MPKNAEKIFQDYYDSLKAQLEGGEPVTESNHDRIHNAAIMKLMLDKGGKISMFCGEMSVFRKDFYDCIAKESSVTEAEEIKSDLANSLLSFLADGDNKLDVLLERKVDGLLDDMIISKADVENALKRETLDIKRLRDDFLCKEQLSHFCSSSSKMVRVEDNKTTHEGIFVGNDAEMLAESKTCFSNLSAHAVAL